MSSTTVDATVLTDALLKRGPVSSKARTAMQGASVLAYAVKEVRHGPFANFVYAHNVLAQERTLSDARARVAKLTLQRYQQRTATQAFDDADAELTCGVATAFAAVLTQAAAALPGAPTADEVLGGLVRQGIERRIRGALTALTQYAASALHPLSCFSVGTLVSATDGTLSAGARRCGTTCALGSLLSPHGVAVGTLAGVVGGLPPKPENTKRLAALRWVASNPGNAPGHDHCRALGDAVYALLCPPGGTVLTTNVTDHQPLAAALGKTARTP